MKERPKEFNTTTAFRREKKRNMKIPAGWTEVKPNNNNINYMRHDLCKFIMANDCYAYDIHVEYP